MLANLINRVKQAFAVPDQQDQLDKFIRDQHPTSVCDVEHWINVYDRNQFANRSANFSNFYRRHH